MGSWGGAESAEEWRAKVDKIVEHYWQEVAKVPIGINDIAEERRLLNAAVRSLRGLGIGEGFALRELRRRKRK